MNQVQKRYVLKRLEELLVVKTKAANDAANAVRVAYSNRAHRISHKVKLVDFVKMLKAGDIEFSSSGMYDKKPTRHVVATSGGKFTITFSYKLPKWIERRNYSNAGWDISPMVAGPNGDILKEALRQYDAHMDKLDFYKVKAKEIADEMMLGDSEEAMALLKKFEEA
jgi:hypothetical protein